tara:strand:- start:294 stop:593 length:300 start_codon:yes stop_codon:yes gene_type:complete
MKKIFLLMSMLAILNGCAQSTSYLGPTYTMAKTGSALQTGNSLAISYGVKSTREHINLFLNGKSQIRECQTSHSSSLSEIFFETLDEIDCTKDSFSILK